jgi:hypothetical protein
MAVGNLTLKYEAHCENRRLMQYRVEPRVDKAVLNLRFYCRSLDLNWYCRRQFSWRLAAAVMILARLVTTRFMKQQSSRRSSNVLHCGVLSIVTLAFARTVQATAVLDGSGACVERVIPLY